MRVKQSLIQTKVSHSCTINWSLSHQILKREETLSEEIAKLDETWE